MKSKKLFAILTLVAFMMTLLPISAFAALTAVSSTPTATTAGGGLVNMVVYATTAEGMTTGDTITVTLPSNVVTMTNVTAGTVMGATAVYLGGAAVSTLGAATFGVSSNVVTITLGAGSAVAAGAIQVQLYDLNQVGAPIGTTGTPTIATSKEAVVNASAITVTTAGAANRFTAAINANKTTVDANNSDTITYTGFVYDAWYNPVAAATPIYVASSRGAADTFVQSGNWTLTAATNDPNEVKKVVTIDATGKFEVKVKSLVAGTATIAFGLNDVANSLYDYLMGVSTADANTVALLKTISAEFKAQSATNISLFEVKLRDRTAASSFVLPSAGQGYDYSTFYTTGYATYKSAQNGGTGTKWGLANGLDYYEISVKVTNAQNAPAADQDVQFSVDKVDAYFDSATVKTDGTGIAKVKLYAKKAGTFGVTYKTGSTTPKEVKIKFDPAEVSKIILKTADNRTLAKSTSPNWKFEVQDSLGNKIDILNDTDAANTVATIDAISQPSGADYKKTSFNITRDTDNNWIKVKPVTGFDKEGTYKLRVTLSNGQYAEFNFEIKQQGPVTALKLKYPQSVLPMGTTSGTPTVTWVDAAGVEKDATDTAFNSDGISFAASDYNKSGAITATNGQFTTTTNKDFVGDLIITAYDNANKLSAAFTITVGRELASLVATAPADKVEVGKAAIVAIKAVDIEGKPSTVGNQAVEVVNAYAVTKPADATVSVDAQSAFGKALKETGTANFEVKSDKAGDVTIFANIKVGANNYTVTFPVSFGEPKQVIGAKSVTMFIGATGYVQDGTAKVTDVAPFIQDSRTFVAVRPIADAFGAEIAWDEATQTVTLTRSDVTLTIVIGSSSITKVAGGVTTTVTADVPAFIKDGRTVLPFRAVGEAFGATVSYDAATQAVSFVQ